ncbi:MAG: HigA family addiction module antidote protein [Saprospiraceae bacterium]|nr:HigA family addiction module antidote protein [Candidatus Defluviibacterium haderslevense]
MSKLKNIHPGEVLNEEFLIPMGTTAYRLAKAIQVPQTRLSEIIKGNRSITADTAVRLSIYFNNSPKFWLGLQNEYDLEEEMKQSKKIFTKIKENLIDWA